MGTSESFVVGRQRTGWDVVLGILSVIAGVVVLGHVALAGVISVLFLGWMLLFGGIALVVVGVVSWSDASARWNVAYGVLVGVLGLSFVRNPGIGLLALTLLAGSLLMVGGILRVVHAFDPGAPKALLLIAGATSAFLGLLVLLGWPSSALWFLGTVLGIELILDGITVALAGRVRVRPTAPPAAAAPA